MRQLQIRIDDIRVPMRDGTQLAADVVVPDDGEPHPVLLVRTPYARASLRVQHDPVDLARRGWAVVLQDVRGCGQSQGTFEPFHQEIDDGHDTIAWCARQRWSDGRVAMSGGSYNGATQWLAAVRRHPALRAISPLISSTDYRDAWSHEGGAFQYGFLTNWAIGLAASRPGVTAREIRSLRRLADSREQLMPFVDGAIAKHFPAYGKWADRTDLRYWRPIEVYRRLPKFDLPAYHVGGWYDIFCEGTIDAYASLRRNAASEYARKCQRLVIGPWAHSNLYFPATPHVDFGAEANGLLRGIPGEMLTFLRGAIDGSEVPNGASIFVMGRNRWVDLDEWPPPTKATRLWLDDATLSWEPPAHAGRDTYRHDPANPVPTNGGRTLNNQLPVSGPMDQRPVEQRKDVLVYTTSPLRRDVTVIGMVNARIVLSSSATRADAAVKLVDVHPDGLAINVADSIRRVDTPSDRPVRADVSVGSTAMTFRRGHRIRVEVASSNFPRFDCLSAGDQTVHTGGRLASYVELPVWGGP